MPAVGWAGLVGEAFGYWGWFGRGSKGGGVGSSDPGLRSQSSGSRSSMWVVQFLPLSLDR